MDNVNREGDMLAGVDGPEPAANHPPRKLIESDRVAGTAVYNMAGERIGTVKRFLVDKRTGMAQYAEMEFGGFLGIGSHIYPLPWEMLDYEADKGGYVVDLTEDQLRDAPHHPDEDRRLVDDAYDIEIRQHFGLMRV